MANTVHVKNIGSGVSDDEVKDFFHFCGKISSFEVTPDKESNTKSATVVFDLPTAASTALLLNHTSLGGNKISVTSDTDASAPPTDGSASQPDREHLTQEEKPRSRIVAEILAHGYVVSDQCLQKAISLDEQHGISARFVATLKQLDEKTRATDRARSADASYGLTQRASSLLTGLGSYWERQRETPAGRRLVDFYTTGQKQVADIHNEARRLAQLKKEEEGGGKVYKTLGLDKVLGTPSSKGASSSEGEGKKAGDVPGGAPANAAATESATKPTAESGTGNPETIH